MLASSTGSTAIRARENIRAWKAEPVKFVREVFRAEPDAWQGDALAAFPTEPRIALVACKGPGKTAWEAWVAWNFLATRPHPKVAATAITGPNLRDNLWAEMAIWRNRSAFLQEAFEIQGQRIVARDHPETWFMAARTWSRDADAEQQGLTLAGFRAPYVLFILDEAGGIPDPVAQKAEANLSTAIEGHIVLGGNPTHLSGPLYRAANADRDYWRVFEVTADPDDPKRSKRVSEQWARDMIARYGRGSSIVQVDVFGRFPSGATDALVSRQAFEDAAGKWESREGLACVPRTLGVDVARYGNDRTEVAKRSGDLLPEFVEWQGHETGYTISRVIDIAIEWSESASPAIDPKQLPIFVDDIGIGGAVVDGLKTAGYAVLGVNVGAAPVGTWDPKDPERYLNLRAQLSYRLAERFTDGAIAVSQDVRNKTTLCAEATTLKVLYAAGTSKKRIEDKETYKRRTGQSPDCWDAAVLAFCDLRAKRSAAYEMMLKSMAEREAAKAAKLAGGVA